MDLMQSISGASVVVGRKAVRSVSSFLGISSEDNQLEFWQQRFTLKARNGKLAPSLVNLLPKRFRHYEIENGGNEEEGEDEETTFGVKVTTAASTPNHINQKGKENTENKMSSKSYSDSCVTHSTGPTKNFMVTDTQAESRRFVCVNIHADKMDSSSKTTSKDDKQEKSKISVRFHPCVDKSENMCNRESVINNHDAKDDDLDIVDVEDNIIIQDTTQASVIGKEDQTSVMGEEYQRGVMEEEDQTGDIGVDDNTGDIRDYQKGAILVDDEKGAIGEEDQTCVIDEEDQTCAIDEEDQTVVTGRLRECTRCEGHWKKLEEMVRLSKESINRPLDTLLYGQDAWDYYQKIVEMKSLSKLTADQETSTKQEKRPKRSVVPVAQTQQYKDFKPVFITLVTVAQMFVFSVLCYFGGIAPIGITPQLTYAEGVKTFIGTETVSVSVYPNVWIGPNARYWIGIGAMYSPCMREDHVLRIEFAKQEYDPQGPLGCCEMSGIFIPYMPQVGATAAVCGFLGVTFIEIVQSRNLTQSTITDFLKTLLILSVFIVSGTLPFVDNFAQIGGFIVGVLAGIIFLPGIDSKKKYAQILFCVELLESFSNMICYQMNCALREKSNV
ncbi:uncharacterized protein LOC117123656 [Anneissia japonica]|uniref:uncharacterized protein LOC117123656 n=1 Tax=Anneissia japonica TaxID=1529436 RepID=UPI0014259920|nr:uncharacterized protein LOC117123656 [Anneissia japonica]